MIMRYRWYKLQLPNGEDSLLHQLALTPLSTESSFGFSRLDGILGESRFRFLWRSKLVVTRFDEEGNPTYDEVATINFTDFVLFAIEGKNYLRLENPCRNLRDLMNAIESLTGRGFTCKPVTFEKSKPFTLFEQVEVTKLVGLKIVDAVVENHLVARMEFASKQGMIVEQMSLLKNLKYTIESAIFEVLYEGVKGQVSFSSSGVVKISGQLAPRIVYLIENDLNQLTAK